MRRFLVSLLRATHLIQFADRIAAARAARARAAENIAFRARFPGHTFPDPALVFEVAGHASLQWFNDSGFADAARIARVLREAGSTDTARLLDWGCGPGRILGHMPPLFPSGEYNGCDPDHRCVEAAKAAYPGGLEFTHIKPLPPTQYPDRRFDAIYGVSILTHLPEASARAWVGELARLATDDGVVVLTTHGGLAAARLSLELRTEFDEGRYLEVGGAEVGSRTFAAYVNETAARTLFGAHFDDVSLIAAQRGGDFVQDIWVLKRPRRGV